MPKIDFQANKTDQQWIEAWDNFWIKVTPIWFDWMQWILVLGLIGYIVEETQNTILSIIYGFSYISFYAYIQGVFYSVEFQGFSIHKV